MLNNKQFNINESESYALELLEQTQDLQTQMACVKAWEACAIKSLKMDNIALRMHAIEHHLPIALKVFDSALANNDSFALVKCAQHEQLANKLYQHKNSLIRTACAKWHHLAKKLCTDESEYVRQACSNWLDIAETLINDPSTKITCSISSKFESLALKSVHHNDPLVRINCALNWLSCAKLLTNDQDASVALAAYRTIGNQPRVIENAY